MRPFIVTTKETVIRVRIVEANSKKEARSLARRGIGDIEDHLSIVKIVVQDVVDSEDD